MKKTQPQRLLEAIIPAEPLSFTTEEALEILAEARAYCQDAGIPNPTADDLRRTIAYEHGDAFADALPRIIATGGWNSSDPCDKSPRGKHSMIDVSTRPSGRPGERLVTSQCKSCGGLIVDCPTISA